ncbi:unnamed protein product [Calypogeia fissa]
MAASRSAAALVTTTAVLVVCVIVFSLGTVEVSAVTNPTEVSVLKQLAATWSSANLNWQGDPCDNSWKGVTCNNSTNPATVTELVLWGAGLQGILPPVISGLTNLQQLELSINRLTGELPVELGQLTNLQILSLQWCNFTGSIPSQLSNLTQLNFLGLNGNQLTGSIPSSFGHLQKLTWLDLSTNNLSGPLPVSSALDSNGIGLDNMTQVKHFHFNNNQLNGSVPPEIFSPQNLIHIIFHDNQLGPSLPTTVSNTQSLQILRLDNNLFSGNIPPEISELLKLVNLNLENNFFSGTIPDLSNLTVLELLDVSNNQFSSQPFPSWVTSLSKLTTLNLAQSNINGPIDSNVFGISQLQSLNLSQNAVDGPLQFPVQSSQTLQWIDVTDNEITGFSGQPDYNGQPVQDVMFMLEGNPLCQNPYLIFNEDLSCGEYNVVKKWSPSVNKTCSNVDCKNGRMLNRKTCACAYPLEVNLVLTAPTLSNLTDAIALDIETQIATAMTSGDYITLDPSQVVIAEGSSTDNVRYTLNLLFFPLTGDSLSTQNETTIVTVLSERQISLTYGPFQVPFSPFAASPTSTASWSAGAIAGIVVGSLALVLLVVAYAVMQKIRADRAVANHPFASWGASGKELGEAPKLKGARWFSLAELKLATDDWSSRNQIGRGGYGRVYKGVLKSGEVVAIKRAQEGSMQGAAEFKNEIELLSRVHHRNLVGLVGFCYEGGEQALIYEFMSNGTVRDHLYGKAQTPFSWQERLDIALGSARGIAYLHDHANPPIIHRDVKTANILLNERQIAKVADFGLSKLAPEDGEMRVYSQNVKGTMGYLDPEYYTTFKLTDRSDVYAFGVVLLELLTAKPPIVNGKFIVREVNTALERGGLAGVRTLLDPALQELPDADLEAFLKIALKCVEEISDDRDSIAEVVTQLENLGSHSHPNVGAQRSDIAFGSAQPLDKFDDADLYFPSPPRGANKESKDFDDPNFLYSGNSNILRSSYKAVTSRLRAPPKRPLSPLSQRADED